MSDKEKIPFYKSAWFLALISVFFPIAGIVMMWVFKKKWHVAVKIILTVVASVWCMFLSLVLLGMSVSTDNETTDITEYTTSVYETESTSYEHIEETTAESTTETTTEATSKNTTTTKTTLTKTNNYKKTTINMDLNHSLQKQ